MAGFLTATVIAGQARDAALSGAATLSVVAFQSYPAPVAFSGDGVLNVSAKPQASLASAATGAGALTGPISPKYGKLLVLAGGGSLTAPAKLQYLVAANLAGGGTLTATVVKVITLLDFIDTFNRADNVSPGAPWVASAPRGDFAISGNMLVTTDNSTYQDFLSYGPLTKDGVKLTLVMGFNSVIGAGQVHQTTAMIRTNDDLSALGGVFLQFQNISGAGTTVIMAMTDAAGNSLGDFGGQGHVTGTVYNDESEFAAGDVFELMSLGDRAALLKNGLPIFTDYDPTHALSTTLNAGERTVTIEGLGLPTGITKIDSVRIQEIDTMPDYGFIDNFNRLDGDVVGSPWQESTTEPSFAISNYMLVNTDNTTYYDGIGYGPLPSDGQKLTLKMGFDSAAVPFNFGAYIRTADDLSAVGGVWVDFTNDAGTTSISLGMTKANGDPVGTAPSIAAEFVAGDVIELMSVGDKAVVAKNGTTLLRDYDPTHALSTTLNAGERSMNMYASCAGLPGAIKIDRIHFQEISVIPDYLSGGGTLSATVVAYKKFTNFNETNIARTGYGTPTGTDGCYATLIGQGGGAGSGGRGPAGQNRTGGSGGGGGGFYPRTFIPVASLGSTYSVTASTGTPAGGVAKTTTGAGNNGTAGAAATFVSGATNISAGGGGNGLGGPQNSTATNPGGAGGTVTGGTGDAGTAGAAADTGGQSDAPNNGASASGGAGGGAGYCKGAVGINKAATKGGDTNGKTGGAGGTSGAGGAGAALTAGVAGSGGGGGYVAFVGGAGTGYGAGGGGGGSSSDAGNSGAGGAGGPAYSLIEWTGGYFLLVPMTATYTQTSVYSGYAAATMAGMTDGTAGGAFPTQTMTNFATGAFIRADLGFVRFIGYVMVGYLPYPFTYPEGLLLQGSNDGSAWTTIITLPAAPANRLLPVSVNASWRYVRIFNPAAGAFAAATELALYP